MHVMMKNSRWQKAKYMQDKDFDAYQKVLRALSHRYINVIEDATDSSDEGSFHWSYSFLVNKYLFWS